MGKKTLIMVNKQLLGAYNLLKKTSLVGFLIASSCTTESISDSSLDNNSESDLSSKSIELSVENITAETEQDENPALNAVDSDDDSRWSGYGDSVDLTLDLGSTQSIDYIKIAFLKGDDRTASFIVYTSNDNSSWTQTDSKTSSGDTEDLEIFDLKNNDARYIKLEFLGNSENEWNSITDIEVYGTESDGETTSTDYVSIPCTVQAEDYTTQSGIKSESTEDIDGGKNIGYIDTGDYLTYNIDVPSTASYTIDFRVASLSSSSEFDIYQEDSKLTSVSEATTGGWQTWKTTSKTVTLSKGNQTIKILATKGGWNINWIEFSKDEEETDEEETEEGDYNLDANKAPSENFDLSTWYLSIPEDNGSGIATSIKEDELNEGYQNSTYFYTGTDGGMVFKNFISGYKTSTNTTYTRTELREMIRAGNTDISTSGVNGNNWVFSNSSTDYQEDAGGVDGTLNGTLKINHVTETGDDYQVGRVVVGQIHASSDEPCRLYYRKLPGNSKGSIYFAHEPVEGDEQWYELIGSKSDDASNPSDGIELDEEFSYEIKVTGDNLRVTISRPGKSDVYEDVDMSDSGFEGDWMYFKAGIYTQNKTGDDDDYDMVTFYELNVSHE